MKFKQSLKPNQKYHRLKFKQSLKLDLLKLEPEQIPWYPPLPAQYSESSCSPHCLHSYLSETREGAKKNPKKSDSQTNVVRIVSIESDEEAEQVADRHDKLKELIEGQNL